MHRLMGLKGTTGLGHGLWGLGLTDARFIGRCMAAPFDSRLCWVLKSAILAVAQTQSQCPRSSKGRARLQAHASAPKPHAKAAA